MAAPHVAGAAALLLPAPPDLDAGAGEVGARADRRRRVRATRRGRSELRPCARAAASSTCRAPTTRSSSPRRSRSRSASSRRGTTLTQTGRPHRRRRRRRRLDRDARAADRGGRRGGLRPADRDGARAAAGDRDDRRSAAEAEIYGLRRPDPRHRAAAHPVLVPRRARLRSRPRRRRRSSRAGVYRGDDAGRRDAGRPLPLSREARPASASRPTCPARSGSSASRSARPAANFGVVVTEPRQGRARRAADRARGRREPADRLRGAAVQPQPVPARSSASLVLAAGAILPARGAYDVVFDSPPPARAGRVHVPVLGRRHDAARARARGRTVRRGAPLVVRATDAGAGVDPASLVVRVDGRERAGAARAAAAISCPRPGASAAAGTRSSSRSPTTRSRGTWRTSRGSCRTRASCATASPIR